MITSKYLLVASACLVLTERRSLIMNYEVRFYSAFKNKWLVYFLSSGLGRVAMCAKL